MTMDFWQAHSLLFLIAAAYAPRLTLLFAVAVPFGWLSWLGWAVAPHVTVAVLATKYYWDTNPMLCVFAWVVAVAWTAGDKVAALSHSRM